MSGRRASRWKRIRGQLIGTHCEACGEPLMFVAADPAWDLRREVICPSCTHSQPATPRELSPADCASVALRVLLLANCLRTAAESQKQDHRSALAQTCREVVDDLAHLSTQLVPPPPRV
jgi:nitric oxide reductase activation protein